jgi:hypothetical protein
MRPALHALSASALLLATALPAQAIVGGTATDAFRHVDDGVQISDSWVLTARHVGYAVGGSYSNGWGSATIAARYDLGGGPTLVDDLALLRLASPIGAAAPLDLLADPLPAGLLASPLAVTIATGSNQVPRGYAFADLAEVIDTIELKVNGVVGNYGVNWLLTYNAGHSAPYVQGGDSGGGLFLGHVTDSSGAVLMGITSAQLQFDQNGDQVVDGYGSGFVQLAAYRSWIDTTMANDPADSQLAHWVSAVPEPAAWALWLAGGALLGGALRRRRR